MGPDLEIVKRHINQITMSTSQDHVDQMHVKYTETSNQLNIGLEIYLTIPAGDD